MPHEGSANPMMNDGPIFHSNMPVSELAERDTRAIESSVVSSTPLVAETMDRMTHKTQPTPTEPNGARGLELPGPYLGTRPTAQVAVRMDTGQHPDRKRHKSL